MHLADDHFIRAQGQVLHYTQQTVGERFAKIDNEVQRRVSALSDDDVLALDDAAWSRQVAGELEVTPPALDIVAAEVIDEGRVMVDCTGAPGISYSTLEFGRPVLRDGNQLRLVIPGTGELELLASRIERGGTGRLMGIHDDRLERVYEWPQVRSAEELDADMAAVLAELEHGCEQIPAQVRQRNEQIASSARSRLEERRQKILAGRSFVGGQRLPVKRRDQAATRIPDLPQAKPRPRAMPNSPPAKPTPTLDGPTLDEFYRHILTVIRNTAVGLERSPGRFAGADEEWLRDHLVVTLNTHYDGAAQGRVVQRRGQDRHPRPSRQQQCLHRRVQVMGRQERADQRGRAAAELHHLARQRLALILFVGAKGLGAVVATTGAEIEQRPEFVRWNSPLRRGELTCQLRWEDGAREATLTIFFVHLPKD
jgi:hypothetical protein